jgi:flagellar biosynthetic protein FlhB
VELAKALAKTTLIGWIVYSFLRAEYPTVVGLVGCDPRVIASGMGGLIYRLLFKAGMVLLILAAVDYGFQRHQNEKQLRMTKEEVKEDYKRSEGDPQVKSKIRQRQRKMAMSRMMQSVPTADVVVTNPTHFAVALKYDADASTAPIVVAKGKNLIAQKIKAIAAEHRVPMVENVQLARALYKSVEVGDEVPAVLYQAVAEILAYVYRLKNQYANQGR